MMMDYEQIRTELENYTVLDSIAIITGAVTIGAAFSKLESKYGQHTVINLCEPNEQPCCLAAYSTRGRRSELYPMHETAIYVLWPGPYADLPKQVVAFVQSFNDALVSAAERITNGINRWVEASKNLTPPEE